MTGTGTRAYVTCAGTGLNGDVYVFDTNTNTQIKIIPVGSNPLGISTTPDGTQIFVANSGSNTVSVINTTSDTVTNTLNVGIDPRGYGKFIGGGLDSSPWWTAAPITVTNLTPTSATLSWSPATDGEGVLSYNVYEVGNPIPIATVDGSTLVHFATGLTPGSSYQYKVEAADGNGNWSTDGPTGTVNTPLTVDPSPNVISTIPGNADTSVPVNSPISLSFS